MPAAARSEPRRVSLSNKELAALGACRVCGRQLLAKGVGERTFYVVMVSRAMFDRNALSDLEIATAETPVTVVVHDSCADHLGKLFFAMTELGK
jgi:hypothetical protein